MIIIDRRQNGKGKSSPNRKKFIDRNKRQIKKSINKSMIKKGIKDSDKDIEVSIDKDTLKEPKYQLDPRTGKRTHINSGNDKYSKGDTEQKPRMGQGGGASNSGEGEDDFTFNLTKEEFFDLYFEDMELPDFIKETLTGSDKFKLKRAGFTKDGVPTRLNSKKTMEMSIARRIAAKAQGKEKPRYLDDVDMRFDNIIRKPYPITKAVMFMIMDVSGSMMERDKMLAKKFFILLYLFLTKCYDEVIIRFLRHTQEAEEVDEQTFFYARKSGGTRVSTAYDLMNKIINEEIILSETNVYVAQASDGDNWYEDNKYLTDLIENKILPKVQYLAYIQTCPPNTDYQLAHWGPDLLTLYDDLEQKHKKFNCRMVLEEKDVYPVLRELFEKAKQ